MEELHLLTNITIALLAAFVGGIAARRFGLPTIVGYLLAGIAIGPFTPGFVGDVAAISELAEIGVIFLMFGVGLHFSLHDLWVVRDIALPGAIIQILAATALGFGLTQLWGWTVIESLIFGLAISVASTVVLLRGLEDQGWLNTIHGRVAVGWLVVEDIATVIILVVLRAFGEPSGSLLETGIFTLAKAAIFVVLMLFVGARFIPWLLSRIAFTGSRELFILTVLVLALGTAFAAAELFGVSLALGAFLAGVMVNESTTSYQVGADIFPFREIFTILFFVSVGMLVNPLYLIQNALQVVTITALIVMAKPIIAALIAFVLPYPARTALVVGAGLSQIGEFSFLLGSAALGLHMLTADQYSLILAGAVISIMLNPLMFRAVNPVESFLKRQPRLWAWLNRQGVQTAPPSESLKDHVVIVGYGRVGHHIVDVLNSIGIPRLVVDAEATRIAELERLGVPTLYGDAANSEVLHHAALPQARALVVTVPDESTAEVIVATARQMAPHVPIIARAGTQAGVTRLAELGAQDVIHPELEGGLEIVRHTLLRLQLPPLEVQKYTDIVRRDHYDAHVSTPDEYRLLEQLTYAAHGMEIRWHRVGDGSPLIDQSVADIALRDQTGASIVAVLRDEQLMANPKSAFRFQVADIVGIIGTESQIRHAEQFLNERERKPSAVQLPNNNPETNDISSIPPTPT
ncbi:MAG TPA: cation:proton antiporter [Anaerolineae bacterium]|nr:cation:proton antiporter [Anaerolineae bacterium]